MAVKKITQYDVPSKDVFLRLLEMSGAIALLDSMAADTIVCRLDPRGESLSPPSKLGMRWRAGEFDDDLDVTDNRKDMKKTRPTVWYSSSAEVRSSHSVKMDQMPTPILDGKV